MLDDEIGDVNYATAAFISEGLFTIPLPDEVRQVIGVDASLVMEYGIVNYPINL